MPRHPLSSRIYLLLGAILTFSFGKAASAETFALGLQQSTTLQGSDAKITFIHANDERCPSDVTCVHPGSAYALLWFELGAKKSLLAVAWPASRADIDVRNKAFGYEFCFVSLEPRTTTTFNPSPHQYVLRFSVEQSSSKATVCRSGA